MNKYIAVHTYKTTPEETWKLLGETANAIALAMDAGKTPAGCLKTWKVTDQGSYIDGEKSGELRLSDLNLADWDHYSIRIGVKDDADFVGGFNLFGRSFGNYEQDVVLRVEQKD